MEKPDPKLTSLSGMFLYARLIIDYLSKQLFRTSEDLRVAIQELPPELRDLYAITPSTYLLVGTFLM